jgi:hypothetical protein
MTPGSNRNLWQTPSCTPASRATRIISSACAGVIASGFSIRT